MQHSALEGQAEKQRKQRKQVPLPHSAKVALSSTYYTSADRHLSLSQSVIRWEN